MLPSWIANTLRTYSRQWLNETCKIDQRQETIDRTGSPRQGWVTLASDVPCRVIRDKQSHNVDAAMQTEIVDSYKIALPPVSTTYSFVLVVSMRVTVGTVVYQVTGVDDDLTDNTFRHVMAKRERGDS
jgi:hypothetical protein